MQTINEKIQSIVNKYFDGNTSKFSRESDITTSTLGSILGERKSKPSAETVQKISNAIAKIGLNPAWLFSEGEMICSESKDLDNYCLKCDEKQKEIDGLRKYCEAIEKLNNEYEIQLGKKDKAKFG